MARGLRLGTFAGWPREPSFAKRAVCSLSGRQGHCRADTPNPAGRESRDMRIACAALREVRSPDGARDEARNPGNSGTIHNTILDSDYLITGFEIRIRLSVVAA